MSAHNPKTIDELLEALQSAERSARESREMCESDISRASSSADAGETNSAILSMVGSFNKTFQSLSDRLQYLGRQHREQGMKAPYQNQRPPIQYHYCSVMGRRNSICLRKQSDDRRKN